MGVTFCAPLSLYVDHLSDFLSREHLQVKARQSGFVRRNRKLTAEDFLSMLLYCSSLTDCSSLDSMCSVLNSFFGVALRKQSLYNRFNDSCLDFVKSILKELIEEQLQSSCLYPGSFWEKFPLVRIKDSTKFKVPDSMKDDFRGNGGSAAGICIQYEYDLSTGKILDLSVGSGGGNDRTDAVETKNQPGPGELVIRDLGYYSLDVFETFAKNNAFFLSRLYPRTCVYQKKANKWEKVDFKGIYKKMLQRNTPQMEMKVFLGTQYKLPVRMILSLVDEQVYQERVRNRETENRKRKQKMAEEVRIRYRFSIYITNAPKEQLPIDTVFAPYRLRWQIELIFKYWKSLYKVHACQKMKQNRYLCMLYAKLILIVIHLQLSRRLQECIQKTDRKGNRVFLSLYKVLSTLRMNFYEIYIAIRSGRNRRKEILALLLQKIANNHWMERKKMKYSELRL